MTPASYRDGARKIAPIAVAAFAFAVSFGVLARASGIHSAEAIVMSATTFAGSAQFAVASILGAAGGVVSAIVAATLLNARYAPISVSVAPASTRPAERSREAAREAGPRLTNYPKGEKTSPVRQALGELAEHPRPKPGHTAGGPLPPRTGR